MTPDPRPVDTPGKWDPNSFYRDAEVAANYDRERFSSLAGAVYVWLERRALLRALREVPKGTQILDLPCGTGRLAEVLLEAGYRVVGADVSAEMLDVAKNRLKRFGELFSWEIRDAHRSSAADHKYAAALCARVLMHFPLEEQISFLKGVAASSKKYVIITHSFDSPYQRARRCAKRVIVGTKSPAAYPVNSANIRDLLSHSGLRELRRIRLTRLLSEAIIIVAERIEIPNEPSDR